MRLISAFFIGLQIVSSSAQADNTDLFELDLRQLMEITVVSKKSETLDEAPGVVSVISRQHIQRYGATNLGDLIDRLPNAQVMGSSLYPDNRTSLRAVTQTHLDDKVLILLNGRPLRDAGQGGVNGDIYRTLPVETIKQIEIIRGPGSVLYGTNAFAGVINIVTVSERTGSNSESNMAAIRLGSANDQKAYAQLAHETENLNLQISAAKTHHDGISYYQQAGELGTPGQHKMGYDGDTLLLSIKSQSLHLQGFVNDTRVDSANNLQSYPSEDWDIDRKFLDLGYQTSLGEASNLKVNLTYNEMQNQAFILSQSVGSPTSFFVTDSVSYLLDTHLSTPLTRDTELIFGASFDQLMGDNVSAGALNTDIDTWRSTFYSQLEYMGFNHVKLIAAGQYHDSKEDQQAFAPRIMAIYRPNETHTIKAGYDEAYRSPFGLDLFLTASFLQGNEDLKSETIKTYTLNHTYRTNGYSTGITLYQSRHEDLIVRNDSTDPVTLENAGYVDYQGIELEYQTAYTGQWQFEGNASYQENESNDGIDDIGIAPRLMVKQGISYGFEHASASVFASYFGEPIDAKDLSANVSEVNTKPKDHVLVSLNLTTSLTPYTNVKGLDCGFYVRNLLDEEVFYPEIARKRVNSFPHRERRTFYIQLEYRPD